MTIGFLRVLGRPHPTFIAEQFIPAISPQLDQSLGRPEWRAENLLSLPGIEANGTQV